MNKSTAPELIGKLGQKTSAHDNIEYISAPMEPQKITGVSINPTTKILVTAKLRRFVPPRKPIAAIEGLVSA
ncbi:hypothetical protein [Rhizobium sp. NLR22b]|uniref:hypothetical protein n=1 Tax=Rhizobium sp. NLR22b TaxID=2731115 RepID=UPI001C83ECDE|nr:hypothetical protein [Rhizobium sp. NLR22b]MBX5242077.1 hypothetical protein [Rhizobium sp. NLR22b]